MDYPGLQEVYDLSTADLKKIQQSLQQNPTGHEDLLQAVGLQIQQRKALQYFAELCHAENPYAKKVAAFNQEFLKLAAQQIQKNHSERINGVGTYQPSHLITDHFSSNYQSTKSQQQNFTTNIKKPVSPISIERQVNSQKQIKKQQINIHSQSDAISTTTQTSVTRSRGKQSNSSRVSGTSAVSGEVKMNIGVKKSGKGKIKQIMQNTLARTLVEDEGIIKRNHANSPHSNINPYKKYHIPGQKHEKREPQNKTKKVDTPQNSQKSIQSKQQIKSNKNIKANSQQMKNRKQMATKIKQEAKKGPVKLPKINQYKDLVEMVKQQQQKKKIKQKKLQNSQKLPNIQGHISKTVQTNYHQKQQSQSQNNTNQQYEQKLLHTNMQPITMQKLTHHDEQNQSNNNMNSPSHSHKIQISSNQRNCDEIIQEQDLQQSLSPNKIQKQLKKKQIQQNNQNIHSHFIDSIQQKINKDNSSQNLIKKQKDKIIQITKNNINDKKQTFINKNQQKQKIFTQIKQFQNKVQNNKKFQIKQNQTNQFDQKQKQGIIDCKQTNLAIDYTRKILQQIEQQQNQLNKASNSNYNRNMIEQNAIIQNSQSSQQTLKTQRKSQQINKKCYSEEYWAHIRQQAQLKIKRFKQQKQYQQRKQIEKFQNKISRMNDDDDYLNNQKQEKQQQIKQQHISNAIIEKLKQEQTAFQKEMAQKNQQLNKLKKQMMKKTNKKVGQAQPTPKITFIRPKPQFDYFSVYPTFNHIFSVMYLKPISQALNDIPNIMRDIKSLFQTHIEHFNNKSNFKPAIFLPFDHGGAFQLTNPKQLIAHAQQTYVDLKVMIERVQIFNQNLHGQFDSAKNDRYYRVIKTKQEVYDIITTSFLRRKGWKQLPHGCSLRSSWDLFWSWSKPDVDLNKLLIWQKINHFPFNKNLSRKDLLYKNLDQFRKNFKVTMNFLPITYNLPKQFSQLSAKFHEQQMLDRQNNYWIMKPIGKSRGRGIKVVSSLSQLNYTDNIVVQKYIKDPMLIEGYKFDMRIYVLVTSFHPLEAFVYKEGFARLSTQKYTLDAHSIKNTFVHLTNFAINKNNVSSNTTFAGGSKISLKTLKDKVTKMGYSFSNIWSQVHDIIVKSLLGCSVSVPSFPTAFELFGYDIMVDQQCNCHLIEINASPSLQRSYMIDEIVKQNLIDDIIDLVDPPQFDKKQLLDVFNQRIQAITNKKKITADDDLIGLARILKYKPVRKIGQRPAKMGLFEIVAPCDTSRELQVLIKSKSGANNPMNID